MAADKTPLPPEPGQDVGPHDGPSPDPHGREPGEGLAPVGPEPAAETGAGDGDLDGLPEPGSQTDAVHVEDDRLR